GVLIRMHSRHIAQIQPLAEEIGHEGVRPGIREHTPHLLFQNCRLFKLPGRGQIQKLTVGYAAPEKKRQTGGQFEVADSIRGARRHSRRIVFDAEQKLRGNQDSLQGYSDSRLEAPLFPADLVEVEQSLDVFLGNRPTISAARQPGENLAGTRKLVRAVGWTAHKNLAATGGLSEPFRV